MDYSALQILYMLKQLLNSSLMEGLKPGCPGKVESGETCHQGFIPNSFGPSAKMQEEEQCAATQPFGHCYNQSVWLIPRIYYTHCG